MFSTLQGADLQLSIADHYFSWQSTSMLLVTPLVTVTGPEAWQSAVPPSYCGLRPVTVYVPTAAVTENRPLAPTAMPYLVPFDSWRVICPARARGPVPRGPPTAWNVPVRVPVGPEGPVGDEQLASVIPAAMTASKMREGGRDDAKGDHDPAPGQQVVRRARGRHRVMLRHRGEHGGTREAGADRDGGGGEQWGGALQRHDASQRGEPGAGEPQQAERPLAVREPARDARGERAAGDREADQDHHVRELLVVVVLGIVLRD